MQAVVWMVICQLLVTASVISQDHQQAIDRNLILTASLSLESR